MMTRQALAQTACYCVSFVGLGLLSGVIGKSAHMIMVPGCWPMCGRASTVSTAFITTCNSALNTKSCFVVARHTACLSGPALPELKQHIPGGHYSSMGAIFLARCGGGVSGAVLMGRYIERTRRGHALLCSATLLSCVGAALIPLARSLPALFAAAFVLDLGLGGVNCACNTLTSWANAANPTPALNVLNGACTRRCAFRLRVPATALCLCNLTHDVHTLSLHHSRPQAITKDDTIDDRYTISKVPLP
jgi:hypothetical protein